MIRLSASGGISAYIQHDTATSIPLVRCASCLSGQRVLFVRHNRPGAGRTDGLSIRSVPRSNLKALTRSEQVAAEQNEHLAAVRRLFREVDMLVFTLGLTETWQSPADGAVYPLCPMVVADDVDPAQFAPVNFSQADVVGDLLAIGRDVAEHQSSRADHFDRFPGPFDRHVRAASRSRLHGCQQVHSACGSR